MPTEPPRRPPTKPKPLRAQVTREDAERFGDEEQVRAAWDDDRLRDERPPHHG